MTPPDLALGDLHSRIIASRKVRHYRLPSADMWASSDRYASRLIPDPYRNAPKTIN
jgi:hypothetical protein